MTPNEEMNQAVTPILESMRTQGVCTREIEIYRNGFYVGAMWRASQQPHNDKSVEWNHRRYEIARDLLAAMVASDMPFVSKPQIDTCVQMADELISVLRKSKVTYAKL